MMNGDSQTRVADFGLALTRTDAQEQLDVAGGPGLHGSQTPPRRFAPPVEAVSTPSDSSYRPFLTDTADRGRHQETPLPYQPSLPVSASQLRSRASSAWRESSRHASIRPRAPTANGLRGPGRLSSMDPLDAALARGGDAFTRMMAATGRSEAIQPCGSFSCRSPRLWSG